VVLTQGVDIIGDSRVAVLKLVYKLHDHGIIHGDVNPRNVVRRADGNELVIVDFGESMLHYCARNTRSYTVSPGDRFTAGSTGKTINCEEIYSLADDMDLFMRKSLFQYLISSSTNLLTSHLQGKEGTTASRSI
jgi:serine/threonine protein kinase